MTKYHPDNPDETTIPKIAVDLVQEVARHGAPNVNDLPPDDDFRKLGEQITVHFDEAVDYLRSDAFPNPHVNEAVRLLWKLVGLKITPAAINPALQTIGFAALGHATNDARPEKGMVCIPPDWLRVVTTDKLFAYASVAFVASQVRDFWNGKLTPLNDEKVKENSRRRARLFEAEYWLTTLRHNPNYKRGSYVNGVLHEYPQGFATPHAQFLRYKSKPFVLITPQGPQVDQT